MVPSQNDLRTYLPSASDVESRVRYYPLSKFAESAESRLLSSFVNLPGRAQNTSHSFLHVEHHAEVLEWINQRRSVKELQPGH